MSMDFITTLTSREQSLPDALLAADLALRQIGARRGESIGRDDVEGLTSRDVEDDEISVREGITPIRDLIADWRDAVIEYRFKEFTGYLQIVLWRAGFLNTLLHVDWRQVKWMYKEGKLQVYHETLATLGTALGAKGGLGDVELPLEPVGPELIPEVIFRKSAPLGLIAIAETSAVDLRRSSFDYGYRIKLVSGFYVLTKD
jgi:hypothetical protein